MEFVTARRLMEDYPEGTMYCRIHPQTNVVIQLCMKVKNVTREEVGNITWTYIAITPLDVGFPDDDFEPMATCSHYIDDKLFGYDERFMIYTATELLKMRSFINRAITKYEEALF